tara:strand:+ start:2727 stop:3242 length:516 start_codon:yes stop_codon:yes gene_type:complete
MNKIIYISLALILFGCEKETTIPIGHDFELDVRLNADSAGYYHLQMSDSWQTLHRISGKVSPVSNTYNLTKVYWASSHYWYIGDTLGYIIHLNNMLNDTYIYSTVDTSYITWFDGFEVPTINEVCYSTEDGEINIMLAPVKSMKGDTIHITSSAEFADGYTDKIELSIILK